MGCELGITNIVFVVGWLDGCTEGRSVGCRDGCIVGFSDG